MAARSPIACPCGQTHAVRFAAPDGTPICVRCAVDAPGPVERLVPVKLYVEAPRVLHMISPACDHRGQRDPRCLICARLRSGRGA